MSLKSYCERQESGTRPMKSQDCLSIGIIKNLQDIDFKSWLVTAKICDDEEIEHRAEAWFTENKDQFREMDWDMEIDRFHLNNEGLQKSLRSFVENIFSKKNI